VLETCVFSVRSKIKKNITKQETQFIQILHTVPKWVLDYAVCHWIVLAYILCMLQHFV